MGEGRQAQEGGDLFTIMIDSHCRRAEKNTAKQLDSNF